MSITMTIRLDPDLERKLENLAVVTERSKSYLAAQAIADYVKVQEWQVSEIRQALIEADAEDFVSHENVVKQWEAKLENSLDKKSHKKS